MSKKETIAMYKSKLASDPQWAIRGLLRIYEEQTAAEKMSSTTHVDNGVGFTGLDAGILTSFATYYKRHQKFSEAQLKLLMKRIPKYAGQLYRLTAKAV